MLGYTVFCITNTKKKLIISQKPRKKAVVRIAASAPVVKKLVKEVKREERKDFGSRLARNFSRPGLGQSIGNLIVPGAGGLLGHAAESLFRTVLGQGEYHYSDQISPSQVPMNNTIIGTQTQLVKQAVDEVHWSGLATRIAHREYFGDVSMTSALTITQTAIDPANTVMFPWLNDISRKFQKWKLLGMVFEYVPFSANAVAGGVPAMGSVSMAVQYDVNLPPPVSLQGMLNFQGCVTGRPTDSLVCAVECDGNYTPANPLYIRHPGVTTVGNFLSFGNLIVATSGPSNYSGAGQLWVSYDLQLISAYVEVPGLLADHVPVEARLGSLHIDPPDEHPCLSGDSREHSPKCSCGRLITRP